jgi:ribonuclease D
MVKPSPPPAAPSLAELDPNLLETLRRWRSEQARAQQLPPYIIFSNKVLEAIAAQRPTTLAGLAAINGVGPAKLEQYGQAVLAITNGEAGEPPAEVQTPPPPVASPPAQEKSPEPVAARPAKPAKEELTLDRAIIQIVTDLEGLITAEGVAQLLAAGSAEIVSFSDHELRGRFHSRLSPEAISSRIQELVQQKEILSGRSGRLILP